MVGHFRKFDPGVKDMTSLHLEDHHDQGQSRGDNIFVRHWLGIVVLAISIFSGSRDGFGWIFGRESKEREMNAQIERLTTELQTARREAADTYARKDLLSEKIDLINYRLTLIDERVKKVSEQTR